jgi:peptidoglycan-N-acetylglucosamine deacetylase
LSHDIDSFDFKFRKHETVVTSVMTKLEKKGKGIILLHDFQRGTAQALPALLGELKDKGYKIVHMKAKSPATTLAEWDDAAKLEVQGAVGGERPTSSSCAPLAAVSSSSAAGPTKRAINCEPGKASSGERDVASTA